MGTQEDPEVGLKAEAEAGRIRNNNSNSNNNTGRWMLDDAMVLFGVAAGAATTSLEIEEGKVETEMAGVVAVVVDPAKEEKEGVAPRSALPSTTTLGLMLLLLLHPAPIMGRGGVMKIKGVAAEEGDVPRKEGERISRRRRRRRRRDSTRKGGAVAAIRRVPRIIRQQKIRKANRLLEKE